jgi:hypothetical protein
MVPATGVDQRADHLIAVLQDYRARGLLAPAQTESLIDRIHEFSAGNWEPRPGHSRCRRRPHERASRAGR